MFDAPLDAWYAWLGLGAVSLVVAGVVLAFPTAGPPAAGTVADAVDRVSASDHRAREEVALAAAELRLGPRTLALRRDGTTARARFAFGPVTPVRDRNLRHVLDGGHPGDVFADGEAFADALADARRQRPDWRRAPRVLTVRRVSWGEVDATLVG